MLFSRVLPGILLIYVSLCFFVTLARAPFGGHRLKGRRSDPPPATHAHAFTMMRAKPHPAPPPPPQPRRQRQRRFTSGRAAMPSFTNADHPLRAQARSPSPIWPPNDAPRRHPTRRQGSTALPQYLPGKRMGVAGGWRRIPALHHLSAAASDGVGQIRRKLHCGHRGGAVLP